MGEFRDWLLREEATGEVLAELAPGLMPEMAAAVSKLMRVQDLITVAAKIRVVTRFRTTVGLPGRLSTRLQPNHPTDDPTGIAASILDGLLLGSGDAVIGINPASDSVETRDDAAAPDRPAAGDVSNSGAELRAGARDHADGSDAGAARPWIWCFSRSRERRRRTASFGVNLALLNEAWQAARELGRGARQIGRERDVLRNRAGERAFGECASWRGSADVRGARLRGGAAFQAHAGEYGGGVHRAGVSV